LFKLNSRILLVSISSWLRVNWNEWKKEAAVKPPLPQQEIEKRRTTNSPKTPALRPASSFHQKPHSIQRPLAAQFPSLKSHTFSQSYGAILPTSLTYIMPKTRGFSPLKPAADICTTWLENYSIPLIFMIGRKGWESIRTMSKAFLRTTSWSKRKVN